jgi:hypothetical protein
MIYNKEKCASPVVPLPVSSASKQNMAHLALVTCRTRTNVFCLGGLWCLSLSGIPKSIVSWAELFLPIFYDAQLGKKEEVDPFILNESNPVQQPNQVPLDDKSVYMVSWVRDKRPLTSLDDTRRHCSSQQSIKSGPCRFQCLDSCERT